MDSQNASHETEHEVRNSINKKRKGGRPRLTPEEHRSFKIKVGFTPSQYKRLAERAETANLNEPEFIRRVCINQPIYTIPKVNATALTQLNKIGTNINQLAVIANSTKEFNTIIELEKITIELQKIGLQIVSQK